MTDDNPRAKADETRSQAEAIETLETLESLEEATSLYNRAATQYKNCESVNESRYCKGWSQLLQGLALMERNLATDAAKTFESASYLFLSTGEKQLRMLSEAGHLLAQTAIELLQLNFETGRLRYGEAMTRLDKLTEFSSSAIKPLKLLALQTEGELKYAQAYLLASKVDLQTALPVITDAAQCYSKASAEATSENTRQTLKAAASGLQAAHRIWRAWTLQKLWKLKEAIEELSAAQRDLSKTSELLTDLKNPTPKQLAIKAKIKGLDQTAQGLQTTNKGFHTLFSGKPQQARQTIQAAEETLRTAENTLSDAHHYGSFDHAFAKERRADSERLVLALLRHHNPIKEEH